MLFGTQVFAQSLSNLFDAKLSYDVYVDAGDGSLSAIGDVEILRLTDVGGKSFLVVRRAGFTFNREEGYILFDHIRAILPNRKLKIPSSQSIKIKIK